MTRSAPVLAVLEMLARAGFSRRTRRSCTVRFTRDALLHLSNSAKLISPA
jgi:hypothetical protein